MVKDVLNTDVSNDINLQGEGGDDIVFGGDGEDQLWGDSSEDAVTTDAQPIPGDYGTYTYYWRERHVGLDGNDYLDGGSSDDQLWGGGGDKTEYPPELRKLADCSSPAYLLAACGIRELTITKSEP